jgi:hypothetical protein
MINQAMMDLRFPCVVLFAVCCIQLHPPSMPVCCHTTLLQVEHLAAQQQQQAEPAAAAAAPSANISSSRCPSPGQNYLLTSSKPS